MVNLTRAKDASLGARVVVPLLGFAAWTLLTLFATAGIFRWSRILTGRATITERRADLPQGSDWYERAMQHSD